MKKINPKLKMARKMQSREERKSNIPPFLCKNWSDRKTIRQVKEKVKMLPTL